MRLFVTPHVFNAAITVPPSKSHTIRRLFMAALTDGVSHIEGPLYSLDTQSCAGVCRVFGAEITEERDSLGNFTGWTVHGKKPGAGVNSKTAKKSKITEDSTTADFSRTADAGNSGTTLFFAIAAAALFSRPFTFTGDRQTERRSAGPLLDALAALGAKVTSKNGCVPITVRGPWKGGAAALPCVTSQYLSAMLIAAPLAPKGTITEIDVPLLNEKPYVEMTLSYLKSQLLYGDSGNFKISGSGDFSHFKIRGGCVYNPVNGPVPGDFSSASYPAAAAVLSGGKAVLQGLNPGDTQGDRIFFDHLKQMGCNVNWEQQNGNWQVTVFRDGALKGGVFDLNAAPDLLPIMAVLGAFAAGETELVNAAHARIKETDRIAVMAGELTKLLAGCDNFYCEEKPGGLFIRGIGGSARNAGARKKNRPGISLDGHGDHRVVLALACAVMGMSAETGPVAIIGAEAADVSYPGFLELLRNTY